MADTSRVFIADLAFAILRQSHVGRRNAIKRPKLLAELQKVDPTISDRRMRLAIAKEKPFVCTSQGGYFLRANDEEVSETVRYIDKKIHGLFARRREIKRGDRKIGPQQLEFWP